MGSSEVAENWHVGINDGEKANGGELGTGNQEPGTGHWAPGTGPRALGTGNLELGTGNWGPGTGHIVVYCVFKSFPGQSRVPP